MRFLLVTSLVALVVGAFAGPVTASAKGCGSVPTPSGPDLHLSAHGVGCAKAERVMLAYFRKEKTSGCQGRCRRHVQGYKCITGVLGHTSYAFKCADGHRSIRTTP